MSNNKKYSVLQVLPHLNSGGLVSGAIEVSSALVKNNFQSYVLSEGGRREREIERDGGILLNLNVGSKNPIIIYKKYNHYILWNRESLVRITKHNFLMR